MSTILPLAVGAKSDASDILNVDTVQYFTCLPNDVRMQRERKKKAFKSFFMWNATNWVYWLPVPEPPSP